MNSKHPDFKVFCHWIVITKKTHRTKKNKGKCHLALLKYSKGAKRRWKY